MVTIRALAGARCLPVRPGFNRAESPGTVTTAEINVLAQRLVGTAAAASAAASACGSITSSAAFDPTIKDGRAAAVAPRRAIGPFRWRRGRSMPIRSATALSAAP
ncbi:hypothetical protein [Arthrobacter methylotrophus]|uniref:hypothetical protein n=1 Tax=Arthrobacter methylotrophus TaxID=121291 RepID=UPI0031E50680